MRIPQAERNIINLLVTTSTTFQTQLREILDDVWLTAYLEGQNRIFEPSTQETNELEK